MTVIAYGERGDAIAALRARYPDAEFVFFDARPDPDTDPVYDAMLRWKTSTNPQAHVVWVDPPATWVPKTLPVHGYRHVVFADKVPAPWLTWAKQDRVEMLPCLFDAGQWRALLVTGSPEAGVPQFTPAAADHVLEANPGGVHALGSALELLTAAEVPQPITLGSVTALWPYSPTKGKKAYAVDIGALIQTLGTEKAVKLAAMVPDREALGPLHALRAVYVNKVAAAQLAKKDCIGYQKRVKLADTALALMVDKVLTGKAALFLFVLSCYEDKVYSAHPLPGDSACPLPVKTGTSSSSTRAQPVLSRLLGMRP